MLAVQLSKCRIYQSQVIDWCGQKYVSLVCSYFCALSQLGFTQFWSSDENDHFWFTLQCIHGKSGSIDSVYRNLFSGKIFCIQVCERMSDFVSFIEKLIINLNTQSLVLSFTILVSSSQLSSQYISDDFCLVSVRNVWILDFVLIAVYGKRQWDYSKLCKRPL